MTRLLISLIEYRTKWLWLNFQAACLGMKRKPFEFNGKLGARIERCKITGLQ